MDFKERELGFQEADRRYAEIKRQRDAGTISDEEFDAQRKRLMVKDGEGRWWAKSGRTGEWNYHDGRAWIRGTPPGYQPLPTPSAERAPDPQPRLEQGERSPSPPKTLLDSSAPIQDPNGGKKRRGARRWASVAVWVFAAVVLVAVVGIVVWMIATGVLEGEGLPPEESSEAMPGYALLKHDSGALSVEVPSEWDERVVVDSEGEKGRAAWSSFLGEGESAGPTMTAVNDLYSWRNGTPGHQGIYTVASKKLAQEYTDDELITSGPNDYSSSCEAGTPQDFERYPYSGKIQLWNNCGGDSEHVAITLAVAPKGRDCVIVAQIGGYFRTQTDEENIQHVLDTLKTNCSKID
jgi:hypothetical protein